MTALTLSPRSYLQSAYLMVLIFSCNLLRGQQIYCPSGIPPSPSSLKRGSLQCSAFPPSLTYCKFGVGEGDRIQTVSTDTNQRTWVPQSKCVTGIRIQRFDTTDTIQISIWILITLHGSGDTIQMIWIMSLVTCFGLCSC